MCVTRLNYHVSRVLAGAGDKNISVLDKQECFPRRHRRSTPFLHKHVDGLAQERRNSIANALEFRLSCTNPSIWAFSPGTRWPDDKKTRRIPLTKGQ